MDIFKEVKEKADILKVCDLLGVNLNRNYKCLCPFHKEDSPSFSVLPSKNIFYCFGCNKSGDVITLVENILNLSPLDSVKFINTNLQLGLDLKSNKQIKSFENIYEKKKIAKMNFDKWENETFQLLCDVYYILQKRIELKDPENPLYVDALHKIHYLDYAIDEIFINGTKEDKVWFKSNSGKVVEEWKKILMMK